MSGRAGSLSLPRHAMCKAKTLREMSGCLPVRRRCFSFSLKLRQARDRGLSHRILCLAGANKPRTHLQVRAGAPLAAVRPGCINLSAADGAPGGQAAGVFPDVTSPLHFDSIIREALHFNVNPQQPRVFRVKFSFREIGGTFSTKIRNFKLWEMPKLLNFRFSEGYYFFKL